MLPFIQFCQTPAVRVFVHKKASVGLPFCVSLSLAGPRSLDLHWHSLRSDLFIVRGWGRKWN